MNTYDPKTHRELIKARDDAQKAKAALARKHDKEMRDVAKAYGKAEVAVTRYERHYQHPNRRTF